MTDQFGLRVPIDAAEEKDQRSPLGWCDGEAAHVRQSIVLILRTRPGTRPLVPGYGCRVHDLLFRPLTPALRGQAEFFVAEALRLWEPRIRVTDVAVSPGGGRRHDPYTLWVRVRYHRTDTPATHDEVAVEYADGRASIGPGEMPAP